MTTNPSELVELISKAANIGDVLDVSNVDEEYRKAAAIIHPDVCSIAGASDATAKLNRMRDDFKKGRIIEDDAGKMRTNGYFVEFEGDIDLLTVSKLNYDFLMGMKDTASIKSSHFKKYLPKSSSIDGNILRMEFDKRAVPLSGLTLTQEHVNWVLSRMLEFCCWMESLGEVHCGLTPDSVFVVPETHGIQVCSFYHMTKVDSKMRTASGKYASWYPSFVFSAKTARTPIDLELSCKTAISLLGDASGVGTRLKRTHNQEFVSFLIRHHGKAYDAYTEYRELLANNFEKKFHILNI